MSDYRPTRFGLKDGPRPWGLFDRRAGWLTGKHGQLLMFTREGAKRRADKLNAEAEETNPDVAPT